MGDMLVLKDPLRVRLSREGRLVLVLTLRSYAVELGEST
jgi:hypothetical protein